MEILDMSTSAKKKAQRQAAHAAAKKQRQYEKLFASKKKSKKDFKEYAPTQSYVRATPDYPSFQTSGPVSTAKQEPKQYTGDYITGIATMHKSNLVPVSRGIDPKDYATMRRN